MDLLKILVCLNSSTVLCLYTIVRSAQRLRRRLAYFTNQGYTLDVGVATHFSFNRVTRMTQQSARFIRRTSAARGYSYP